MLKIKKLGEFISKLSLIIFPEAKEAKIILCLILFCSLGLNSYGIWWGVPSEERMRLYFEDEDEICTLTDEITEEMTTSSMTRPKDKPTSFYNPIRSCHPDESNFIKSISNMDIRKLNFNPHYFYYGSLYIYMLLVVFGLAWLIGYIKIIPDITYYFLNPGEMAKFYILGRFVSVIMIMLVVYLVYRLGRKLYDRKVGLVASLFTSVIAILIITAHCVAVDATMLGLMCLTFLLAVNIQNSDKTKWYIWAGVCSGLTANTKYTAGLIIIIIPLVHFLKSRPSLSLGKALLHSFFNRKSFLAYIFALVSFLVMFPYFFSAFGFISQYLTAMGSFGNVSVLEGCLYYLRELWVGLGPLLFLLAILGVVVALIKRKPQDILILCWIGIIFCLFAAASFRMPRYIIPVIPFLMILGSRAVIMLLYKFPKYLLMVIILIFGYSFLYALAYDNAIKDPNVRTEAGQWVNQHIETGSTIGLFRLRYQYVVPPLNERKYQIVSLVDEKGQACSAIPDYFIVTEIEMLEGGVVIEKINELKNEYKIVKKITRTPKILGQWEINRRMGEYLYFYPEIFIYQRMVP